MSDYRLTGRESLGIEFGSTRIKAVLTDEHCKAIASGSYTWENRFENGVWTYHLDDVWQGLRSAYSDLNRDCNEKFNSPVKNLASVGFSAMMHGYLVFDENDKQLCEFRTWRNTITEEAAAKLTDLFSFNIPQRWSIAHLYQAVLNGEEHTDKISRMTTLAGYVHYSLTGENVLGVGEASGMFPIDTAKNDYDEGMLQKFSSLPEVRESGIDLRKILPKVLTAGENAGFLTEKGARLIDESGNLPAGIPLCPPEGDAGTGMVATNSITERTGNVSAGTSIFSMVVLEKKLSRLHEEIDIVTTPDGKGVAMVHCNNCCTDLDCWVGLFSQFAKASGSALTKPQIYDLLYNAALDGDADCGGIINFNCFSGEPVVHTNDGRPLLTRTQDCSFNLSNFMRSQIYSTMAALRAGMDILDDENVKIDRLTGHGGLFKTPFVGQKFMAGAMNSPVTVTETAGEGGAWGMAILASYLVNGRGKTLEQYLRDNVFASCASSTVQPDEKDVAGFNEYMKLYRSALPVEKCACENI